MNKTMHTGFTHHQKGFISHVFILSVAVILALALIYIFYIRTLNTNNTLWPEGPMVMDRSPRLEYSVKPLGVQSPEKITLEAKQGELEIKGIVLWDGSYEPELVVKDNNLQIVFSQVAISSAMSPYTFAAKIANLKKGKYTVQMMYPQKECLYLPDGGWEPCSKLDPRAILDTKETLKVTWSGEGEIK